VKARTLGGRGGFRFAWRHLEHFISNIQEADPFPQKKRESGGIQRSEKSNPILYFLARNVRKEEGGRRNMGEEGVERLI